MKFALVFIAVVCSILACQTQAHPIRARGRPELKLQLLKYVINQVLIQEDNQNQDMTKTYCKLVYSLLKMVNVPTEDDYCDDIDDDSTFPGLPGINTNTGDFYKTLLNILKNLFPSELTK